MQRKVVLTLALVLCLASYAQAALSIVNSNHTYVAGTTSATIQIFVTGVSTDTVDGMAMNVEIADPSFLTGIGNFPAGPTPTIGYLGNGVPLPNATNGAGDSTGNFMFLAGHAVVDNTGSGDQWNIPFSESLTTSGANIAAATTNGGGGAGLLMTLQIDFTGYTAGVWRIIMDGENGFGATSFAKVVLSNQVNVPVNLELANFTVTLVPEPTSVVLGLFAAAALGFVAIRKRRVRA